MRRGVWGPLLLVVGVLAGASLYARRDQVDLAAVRTELRFAGEGAAAAARTVAERAAPLLAGGVGAVRRAPLPVAIGAAGVVLVALTLTLLRRRRRTAGAVPEVGRPDEPPAFGHVLASAMVPGGADGRRHRVLTLARDGRSIGEIARSTRLSQDAVRTVLDAR